MSRLAELLAKGWEEVENFQGAKWWIKPPNPSEYTLDEAFTKEFGGAGDGEAK